MLGSKINTRHLMTQLKLKSKVVLLAVNAYTKNDPSIRFIITRTVCEYCVLTITKQSQLLALSCHKPYFTMRKNILIYRYFFRGLYKRYGQTNGQDNI